MNIHEYQAKMLLELQGLPIQKGVVATSATEALKAADTLEGPYVVKAQIHAGGRGLGGGIKFAETKEDVQNIAQNLLGKPLITPQTGPEGKIVHKIYVVEAANFSREYYLSFFIDRAQNAVTLMLSNEGGGHIEETAPDKIKTLPLSPLVGLRAFHTRQAFDFLGLNAALWKDFAHLLQRLYGLFMARDMDTLEINPLVVTDEGQLLIVDTKMVFDDNALYRQSDIFALKDPLEYAPQEIEAAKHDLSYVQLQGNIGCMVNGAGLAMATMDAIEAFGGKAANFLDVGGSASFEQIKAALDIILKEDSVKAVLVNIFGGIMHCDLMARALLEALAQTPTQKPLVVRLEGTHVDEAKALLAASDLAIEAADSLDDACRKVIACAGTTPTQKGSR
ncbi:MAG: ADP-forming succinate--CoA ligase subunit beta [Holosporaceae bacterium]